jgi:hypothetical protein
MFWKGEMTKSDFSPFLGHQGRFWQENEAGFKNREKTP